MYPNKKIETFVKQLPHTPGIYLMKDAQDKIIYVGKAKNLHQRVRSYFQKNTQHSKKVLRMVFNIANLEIIQVDTELDALLLECNYIQKYHPLYNRQMNFSLRYNYVTITQEGIYLTEEATANSLGPFRLYKRLPEIIRLLSELYQLPWINHITMLSLTKQLPDMQLIPLEQRLQEINQFFTGENASYRAWMLQRIHSLSEAMHFELAQALVADLEILDYFFNHTQAINHFIHQKEIIFSLPIQNQRKHYQISYGQIIHTKILPENELFIPISQYATPIKLTKTILDPLWILFSYIKKTSKEEVPL
ncbi:GIY-YIG nuclease family protein [Enterococcus saccharolyticus]|nr:MULTISPECIES: GIY-YIG nuclease family protein [Enterococcus]MCD5001029.1 GIY-YIG nuclease family protein [Enterococcus saccharolyticus]